MTTTTKTLATFLAASLAACGSSSPATTTTPPPGNGELIPIAELDPKATPEAEPAPAELAFPEGEEFRAKQPEPGPVPTFKAPKIAAYKLKNGVAVYHVEDHTLPTVSMELVFETGAIADPKGKEGAVGLCAGLLSEGTKDLDKLQFSEALADLASSVSSGASTDQVSISAGTLSRNLAPTLDLWAASILTPGLRQDEFERAQKRALARLKQIKGSPEAIASRVSGSIAYGEGHPYARISTEASLTALTLADCQALHKDAIKPAGAKLYVVGDVTRAQVEELVGGRLATWTGKPKKAPAVKAGALRKGKIFIVDVPGAPQSVVSLIHLGPQRKAKDYFDTRIMSAILGGGFSSRINMNLREDKGWTYGARGSFNYSRIGSTFVAGGSIKAEHTTDAILEIYKEIAGVKSAEVKDEELAREKNGTVLGLPALFATGSATANAYRQLIYFGLPLDYFDGYVAKVVGVSKATVKKTAGAYLKPQDLRILVIGDAKSLEPKLTALLADKAVGAGTVVKLDADGNVKP